MDAHARHRTRADVRKILTRAEALSRRDCSREHIAQMRTIVMDAQDAKDIGFLRDGCLACTSLGMIERPIARPAPDAELSGGFTLALRIEPQLLPSRSRAGPEAIGGGGVANLA